MEQSPPLINVNVLASIHEGAVFIVHNAGLWNSRRRIYIKVNIVSHLFYLAIIHPRKALGKE